MKENLNKGDEEAEDEVEINHLNVGSGGETVGKLRYVVLWEGSSIMSVCFSIILNVLCQRCQHRLRTPLTPDLLT